MLRAPVSYDPDWPLLFGELQSELRLATGLDAVFHIGSTAVPGLIAKPIIDMQLGVTSLGAFDPGTLDAAGFDFAPEIDRDDAPSGYPQAPEYWRKQYARRYVDGIRVAHLHIRQFDLPNFRLALLVRDFLRADLTVAEQYGKFKKRAAAVSKHASEPGGSGAYLDLKDPFVALLIKLAETWAEQTQWTLPQS